MSSVFTKVRKGELPGQVLYEGSDVFVMLTIEPHNPGHALVIPIEEYPELTVVSAPVADRLMAVSQQLMRAYYAIYQPPRVALVAAGLDIDHTHLHVFSLFQNSDLDPRQAHPASAEELKVEADKIRSYLKENPIT